MPGISLVAPVKRLGDGEQLPWPSYQMIFTRSLRRPKRTVHLRAISDDGLRVYRLSLMTRSGRKRWSASGHKQPDHRSAAVSALPDPSSISAIPLPAPFAPLRTAPKPPPPTAAAKTPPPPPYAPAPRERSAGAGSRSGSRPVPPRWRAASRGRDRGRRVRGCGCGR